jgi:hypothetical protein
VSANAPRRATNPRLASASRRLPVLLVATFMGTAHLPGDVLAPSDMFRATGNGRRRLVTGL